MEIREGHNKFYINDEQGKQIAEIVLSRARKRDTGVAIWFSLPGIPSPMSPSRQREMSSTAPASNDAG